MNQEELTALIVIKVENLGIDYRTFEYDNQRAWIDTRLCIGGYNPNTATPFDHAHKRCDDSRKSLRSCIYLTCRA